MKTSTPNDSPRRRKISSHQNAIQMEDVELELEAEKQRRILEAINKSTEVRRRSVAPPLLGFNATQLAQHCKDCIKLSTENKINTKNAFSFLLIDFMAAMAKKSDSEINKNFQVASCTLDASVKIYGYRVDAVHTEAVKIAGGFLNKEVANVSENEDKGSDGEGEEVKKPKKKKKKKLSIVNPDTLNAKTESELLMDVCPQQNFLVRHGDSNDLLIKIQKYNDEGILMIDCDWPSWPFGPLAPRAPVVDSEENNDVEELVRLLKGTEIPNNVPLSSMYSKFDFCKEADTEHSDEELEMSQTSNRFEFDMNGSIQDVAMSDGGSDTEMDHPQQRTCVAIPAGGYDSGDEIVPMTVSKPARTKKIDISDMKRRISVDPLEYSMFDEKILKSWAGPKYWKIRPSYSKQTSEDNENEDASKQVASKRTRKGKIKEVAMLFEVSKEVLVQHLSAKGKAILCMQTMRNWNPRNTTMPKDCKYSSRKLFSLYHLPLLTVKPRVTGEDTELEEESMNDDGGLENAEELDYCSSLVIQDQDNSNIEGVGGGEIDEEAIGEEGDLNESRIDAWDADNMVAAPSKVQKIAMSTFRRKRHVDIRHLKKSIWNVLIDADNSGKVAEKTCKVTRPINFSEIMRASSSKLASNGISLSAPLIFNALLHLTNEKCLILTQNKTSKKDFEVFQ